MAAAEPGDEVDRVDDDPAEVVEGDQPPEAFVPMLDHASGVVRWASTLRLMDGEALSAQRLREFYAAAESPEARRRLLRVAHHHAIRRMAEADFPAGPHDMGAIGVVLRDGGFDEEGGTVRVAATLPGFPGAASFEPGDEIVAVSGRRLDAGTGVIEFTDQVQQLGPSRVTMRVRRGDEEHDVTFTLSTLTALSGMYMTDQVTQAPQLQPRFEARWREELASLLAAGPRVKRLE